jgi:hypothetical protein
VSELIIESWPIDRPKPYAKNARRLSDRAVATIAASLKEYGWRQPIVVDGTGVIVAGHTRLLAAKSLGLAEVPVHVAAELTPEQIAGYRLMDNRSNEETDWDEELLGRELLQLQGDGFNLALTGFTKEDLSKFLKASGLGANQVDEDETPEPPAAPVSVVGDIWLCGEHRVMCGDATSDAATSLLFAGRTPDVVFSDPPYGISVVKGKKVGGGGVTKFGKVGGGKMVESSTYAAIENDHNTDAARGFYECSARLGVRDFILWGGNYFTDFLPPSACWLIWDKQNTGNFADVEMAWSSYQKGELTKTRSSLGRPTKKAQSSIRRASACIRSCGTVSREKAIGNLSSSLEFILRKSLWVSLSASSTISNSLPVTTGFSGRARR